MAVMGDGSYGSGGVADGGAWVGVNWGWSIMLR